MTKPPLLPLGRPTRPPNLLPMLDQCQDRAALEADRKQFEAARVSQAGTSATDSTETHVIATKASETKAASAVAPTGTAPAQVKRAQKPGALFGIGQCPLAGFHCFTSSASGVAERCFLLTGCKPGGLTCSIPALDPSKPLRTSSRAAFRYPSGQHWGRRRRRQAPGRRAWVPVARATRARAEGALLVVLATRQAQGVLALFGALDPKFRSSDFSQPLTNRERWLRPLSEHLQCEDNCEQAKRQEVEAIQRSSLAKGRHVSAEDARAEDEDFF